MATTSALNLAFAEIQRASGACFDPLECAFRAKRRVFHPQASEVLAELFGARIIDPRVLACKPLVESLTMAAPQDGYRPVSGGSLDLQTAWLALVETLFGNRWEAPSLTGILAWSLDERKLATFRKLSSGLREALTEWLVRSRGEAARFILTAAECGAGQELVPLGLLVGILFQAQCRGLPETQAALGRLERYFNNREIDEASAGTPLPHHACGVGSGNLRRGQELGTVREQPNRPILAGFGEPFTDWLSETSLHVTSEKRRFLTRDWRSVVIRSGMVARLCPSLDG